VLLKDVRRPHLSGLGDRVAAVAEAHTSGQNRDQRYCRWRHYGKRTCLRSVKGLGAIEDGVLGMHGGGHYTR
jgi:hypothetical protein